MKIIRTVSVIEDDQRARDPLIELAVWVILRAWRDARSSNKALAREAQAWLNSTGREWLEVLTNYELPDY